MTRKNTPASQLVAPVGWQAGLAENRHDRRFSTPLFWPMGERTDPNQLNADPFARANEKGTDSIALANRSAGSGRAGS